MQINSKSIKKQFEKSMEKYNENAIVQKFMAEKLAMETAKIRSDFNTILELGSGTGLLTEQIKLHMTFKKFYANDLIKKSESYINKIIPETKFIHGNATRIKLPEKPDLIISNAMFQWFNDLAKVVYHYKKILNNDGIIAFSTFGKKNFCELKEISGLTLNYLSKDELINTLEPHFKILYELDYIKILDFESPLAILAHMKNTGVNSLSSKIWTINNIKTFCNNYLEKYPNNSITYNPILIIAQLKSPLK